MKKFEQELKEEIERNEEEFLEICNWRLESVKIDARYSHKSRWRQDERQEDGLQSTVSETELLHIQMKSDDVLFQPKHTYDFDIYLHHLLTRAHKMNSSFQYCMRGIFARCHGCKFVSGPIKGHERSKMKAQVDYRNSKFPKSAHIIDVVRCQVNFLSIVHLRDGLLHFEKELSKYLGHTLDVMRIKNGFEASTPRADVSTQALYSRRLNIAIPSEYKDIKVNIVYIHNDGESIVGEVQFLLDSMASWKQQQHQMYEISRQEEFIRGSLQQIRLNHFDFQLQLAGFNVSSLTPLMLFFPSSFATSQLILKRTGADGKNFVAQMANSSDIQFHCAHELLHSKRYIPEHVVQHQLLVPCKEGAFPLMYALWKQPSTRNIELFVPSSSSSSSSSAIPTIWHSTNTVSFFAFVYSIHSPPFYCCYCCENSIKCLALTLA
ncbi:hypothetical protein RFI_01368 [Reticulomyxa filosa]|uniref:Uncharacterized protein n=1 Tax=Reticulomyxa filosa TaxID=46433 RepID=X6PBY7_RETFI|nr:hypothetical protein RFI_01368 [Reticulomyxa filosa]|eukprot:ETO35691.1 hypothetical protein RFI_01368 [Reticulomyxa filosa]